jgi:N-acetyl-anhydromuramyl-L-alanine amidase AmpD
VGWVLPAEERLPSPNANRGRNGWEPDVFVVHFAVDGDQTPDDDELDPFGDTGLSFAQRDRSHDCMDVARLFARDGRDASTHFVIGRDASKVQCVGLDDTAWGAGGGALPRAGVGPLERPRSKEINRRSVQVELCNAGFKVDALRVPADERSRPMPHPGNRYKRLVWELYPDRQIAALLYVMALSKSVKPSLRWVVGHEDVVNSHVLSVKHGRKVYGGKVDPGPAFPWERVGSECRAMGMVPVRYDFKRRAWVER